MNKPTEIDEILGRIGAMPNLEDSPVYGLDIDNVPVEYLGNGVDFHILAAYIRDLEKTQEMLQDLIESAQIIHFERNGQHCVIYLADDETFTLFGGFGESTGHTHLLDALTAFDAIEAAQEKPDGK